MRKRIPEHVAIIMDGNARWARERGLSRLEGHRAGMENIRRVVEGLAEHQVKYLTLFAFSTENWGRPRPEVRGLLRLLGEVIDREAEALHQQGVRLRHLGQIDKLPPRLQQAVEQAIELTRKNTRMTLSIAFDYGGRAEILEAVRRVVSLGLSPGAIDEALFSQYLYTAGLPDPDLIIRTAGEQRLSNFLLWQAAYSECYFTPVFWPDFDKAEIKKALLAYGQRDRRFGRR